jgi:hypothetical protein
MTCKANMGLPLLGFQVALGFFFVSILLDKGWKFESICYIR